MSPRSAERGAPRLGVFGGTFDPPHLGHLAIAEWARVRLRLDRVVFVPSGVPPHKIGRRRTPAAARLAMTRLAVRGNPAFEVSPIEVRRRGPSFTIDTLRALGRRYPRARLHLLMGADSLAEFHTWREPEAILDIATLVVAGRGGPAGRAARALAHRVVWLQNPGLEISSSMLRERCRLGLSIRYLVPEAVARWIERHRPYGRTR